MNLQMSKDLQHKASYDYWKSYFYEKGEKMKRFSSLLSSEADYAARVSVEETAPKLEASHKCSLCGKCFTSGKALGGHSRSHSQASKKKFKTLFFNNSKEGTSLNFNDDDDDIRYNNEKKDHICYICKKNFPTKNALYGHMRSHPDRVCKGVSPPTNHHHHNLSHENENCSSNSQSSISSVEHNKEEDKEDGFVEPKGYSDFDLSKSPLPRWKKRDKRGRKYSETYEAAMNLMHLSANNTKYLCSLSIEKFELPKSFAESSMKKRELGESSSSSTGKEQPMKKIKFVVGGSLNLGTKSKTVFCDTHMLNKGKGLLSEYENNLEPSQSAGPKRLVLDLNEPYIRED